MMYRQNILDFSTPYELVYLKVLTVINTCENIQLNRTKGLKNVRYGCVQRGFTRTLCMHDNRNNRNGTYLHFTGYNKTRRKRCRTLTHNGHCGRIEIKYCLRRSARQRLHFYVPTCNKQEKADTIICWHEQLVRSVDLVTAAVMGLASVATVVCAGGGDDGIDVPPAAAVARQLGQLGQVRQENRLTVSVTFTRTNARYPSRPPTDCTAPPSPPSEDPVCDPSKGPQKRSKRDRPAPCVLPTGQSRHVGIWHVYRPRRGTCCRCAPLPQSFALSSNTSRRHRQRRTTCPCGLTSSK